MKFIIMNITGIGLTILGTGFTLWRIFHTDACLVGTWAGLGENAREEFLKERKKVKVGLFIIVVGGILQSLSQIIQLNYR